MERLTSRMSEGTADGMAYVVSETGVEGVGYFTTQRRLPEVIARLAEYEDTGFSPSDIKTMRNELCIKCGNYQRAHEGACDGCRWRQSNETD